VDAIKIFTERVKKRGKIGPVVAFFQYSGHGTSIENHLHATMPTQLTETQYIESIEAKDIFKNIWKENKTLF
jgi:uncharacterized caspase-like protein